MRLAWTLGVLLFWQHVVFAGKPQVASLSSVLTDTVRKIAGDKVEIIEIVKPGMDPHVFDPAPGDIKRISRSSIIFASGLGFEGYLQKLQDAAGRQVRFVIVGDSVKPLILERVESDAHGHSHGHSGSAGIPDPHWWHSISNMKIAGRIVRDALSDLLPAEKQTFHENTKVYLRRLDELSQWARREIARLPARSRILVTSHESLGYFARDYEFKIYPVQGISTLDQPSSQKVRALIEDIKRTGVKAVFADNIENPKVLTELTRETGVEIGGVLYSDSLGEHEADTYESMMRHNIETIVKALAPRATPQ